MKMARAEILVKYGSSLNAEKNKNRRGLSVPETQKWILCSMSLTMSSVCYLKIGKFIYEFTVVVYLKYTDLVSVPMSDQWSHR